MRRFGIHGVVTLAGLVACSRFDTDTNAPPASPPDASDASDSGAPPATDGGRDAGPSGPRFCEQHVGARFCADFEGDDPPAGVNLPKGAAGFTREIAIAPSGRKAMKLAVQAATTSWGFAEGAFGVPLDKASFTTATLSLEIMCETADFGFVRSAGFVYTKDATETSLSTNLLGQITGVSFDTGVAPSTTAAVVSWAHLEMQVARSEDGKTLNASSVKVNDTVVGAPKSLDIKEATGNLFAGFGVWDISLNANLVVWIDDVLLTTQ